MFNALSALIGCIVPLEYEIYHVGGVKKTHIIKQQKTH